jgi:hypothetical protein
MSNKRTRNSFDISSNVTDVEDFSQIEDLDSLFDEPMDWEEGGKTLMYETSDSPKVKTYKRIKIGESSPPSSSWMIPPLSTTLGFPTPLTQSLEPKQQNVQTLQTTNMPCEGSIGKTICRPILFGTEDFVTKTTTLVEPTDTFKLENIPTPQQNRTMSKKMQKERKNFKERKRRVATAEKFNMLSKLCREITACRCKARCSCNAQLENSQGGRTNKLAILTDAVRVMQHLQEENRVLKMKLLKKNAFG